MIVGNQTLGSTLKLDGMTVLPRGGASYLDDVLEDYYQYYERDLLITLFDVWVLDYIRGTSMRWVPLVPIDADLFPECERILKPLSSAYSILAFSRYGFEQLKQYFANVDLIFHGVDTNIYRPLEEKARFKKQLELPEDCFLFGNVATNIGDRKDFPRLLRIFSKFLKSVDSDNVYLYLHTDVHSSPGVAYDIELLARRYGVLERLRVPRLSPGLMPYTEAQMAKLYNAFDCFISATRGEGFGVPFLEAMACGVPCIAPDHSSLRELLEDDAGILVKTQTSVVPLTVPTLQEYKLVDEQEFLLAMIKMYQCPELRNYHSEKSVEKARKYDWSRILADWQVYLSRIQEEVSNLKELVRS